MFVVYRYMVLPGDHEDKLPSLGMTYISDKECVASHLNEAGESLWLAETGTTDLSSSYGSQSVKH